MNIALIENGAPSVGVVYAPALKRIWWGGKFTSAHVGLIENDQVKSPHEIRSDLFQKKAHGLNKDLGLTEATRVENIRRVVEVARLMADAGLIVLVSFISPFNNERRIARETAGDIAFLEAYVDTPLAICEARDPKGLYGKARRGEITSFTGIDSPFEVPERADLVLHGATKSPEEMADEIYYRTAT